MLPTYHRIPTSPQTQPIKQSSRLFSKALLRWTLLAATLTFTLYFFWDPVLRPLLTIWDRQPDRPRHINYASVNRPPPPSIEEQAVWRTRKDEVKEAFQHAWTGYRTKAFPSDEILPVSGQKSNKFNGWGVTLFDSLDTMWIMGLHDEFSEAVDMVKDIQFNNITKPDFAPGINHFVPFFETTIRYLGGLLSAFAFSGDETLLKLADQVGDILVAAFNETKSGLPAFSVDAKTGKQDGMHETLLFAEATSCQLEFKYLAKLTGKKKYYERVEAAMDIFYRANVTNGLFADNWSLDFGQPRGGHLTVGGGVDSGYEYFLKQWVLNGDEKARNQYMISVDGILNNLVFVTPARGLMYVTDKDLYMTVHRQEHLSCFLPAVLSLGALLLDLPPDVKELHQWAAKGLTYTCAISYADQESGLGPEEIRMDKEGLKWIDEVRKWEEGGRVGVTPGLGEPQPERNPEMRDYSNGWPSQYLLRPETVESIFYMWRTTGDVKWRERGYEIFKSINANTRAQYGYSSVSNIDGGWLRQVDDMPSYFLAETLKYLYLLFDDVNSITLDQWVFNTEAHPLPIFAWTESEINAFNITR